MNSNSRLVTIIVAILVAIVMAIGPNAFAAEPPNPIRPFDTNWYDSESDTVRAVVLDDRRATAQHRNSDWTPRSEVSDATAKTTVPGNPWGTWSQSVTAETILLLIGWTVLISVLSLAAILISRSVARFRPGRTSSGTIDGLLSDAPDEQTIRRMSHLPDAVRRTDVNLRQETKRLLAAQQYDAAVITLLAHQLLMLDRSRFLRLARGKTNRTYVESVMHRSDRFANILQGTVGIFDRSYFGQHRVTKAMAESLWNANEQLENDLQSIIATALKPDDSIAKLDEELSRVGGVA